MKRKEKQKVRPTEEDTLIVRGQVVIYSDGEAGVHAMLCMWEQETIVEKGQERQQ